MLEVFGADGLGDEVVHAGLEAEVAVCGEGVGSHGDDGDAGGRPGGELAGADAAGTFVAVHGRHLDIHEDCVEGAGFEDLECGVAVGGDDGGVSVFREEAGGESLIDGVVLNEEDSEAGEGERWGLG